MTAASSQIKLPRFEGPVYFKRYPVYWVDPLGAVAIGLKLGQDKMDQARAEAKSRGIQEYAIVGGLAIRLTLKPSAEEWPPEGFCKEFLTPDLLLQAKAILQEPDDE